MKKYLISASIAFATLVSVAGAQNFSFQNDLRLGSSGSDVVNMQTWLMQNGFSIPSIASGAAAKGYFGVQTQAALSAYQRSIGLPAFGFFGPMTRKYFNGNNYRGASLQVTLPNGGETWVKGTTQNITWAGAQGLLSQTADIRLEYPVPACAQPGQPIRCMIMQRAPLIVSRNVPLSWGSYPWTVGTTRATWCQTPADDSSCPASQSDATDGQYKIQICPTSGSQCAESANNFTITSNTNPTPTPPPYNPSAPVINRIDGPSTLNVGQTGTWTIYATDPQGRQVNYSIDWGEPVVYNSNGTTMAAIPTGAPNTFTHSYANAGTYTIKFTVSNGTGLTTQNTATVTVTGSNQPSITVLSPNGGEVWQANSTQQIKWNLNGTLDPSTRVDMYLGQFSQNPCAIGAMCVRQTQTQYVLDKNIASNVAYNWIVGTDTNNNPIPAGTYSLEICIAGSTTNCDISNSPFTITASQAQNSPLTVSYPSQGATLSAGMTYTITWAGVLSGSSIYSIYLTGGPYGNTPYNVGQVSSSANSLSWTVPWVNASSNYQLQFVGSNGAAAFSPTFSITRY
jgi:hypothetical protein